MSRPRSVACLLTLLAAGCGGGVQSTVPRPADLADGRPVQSLFAEDTASLAWVDLAAVRDTELYEVIGEDVAAWGRALDELGEGLGTEEPGAEEGSDEGESAEGEDEDAALLELLGTAEWMLVASTAPSGADDDMETVSLIGGELTEAQVRALVRAEAEEMLSNAEDLPFVGDGEPTSLLTGRLAEGLGGGGPDEEAADVEVRSEESDGRRMLVAGEVVGSRVVEGVWIVGPRSRVDDVLARIDGRMEPTGRLRTHAVDRVMNVFDHQMALVLADLDRVRGRTSLLDALRGDEPVEDPVDDWWSNVEALGVSVDLGEGVDAGAVLQANGERAARTLVSESGRAIRDAVDDDVLGVMGLPRLLRQVHTQREGSVVRLGLSLDRAEAHLYWGKISGAIGAALVVVDLIAGFFSGFGDGLGDFEEPDAPVPPGGLIEGAVIGADAGAPVQPGARCTARIIPGEPRGFGWTCHATVECDGKTLYGGPDSGWFACHLGTDGDWFVVGDDAEPSSVDGDATLHVDTMEGRMDVTDDVQGAFGDYRIEIGVEAAVPEPATTP